MELENARAAMADYFRTDHLHGDLKGRSVRGGAATVGGRAVGFVLGLVSTAILARLLTPTDFGLIAMVMAVIGFAEAFKDMGLSMATVQRDTVNHGQVSTLFWVNVAISTLLSLLTCALAPGIAWLYSEPRLILVTLALAGTFLFGGLTIQHQALLHRQMRFGTLAMIAVAAQGVGIGVAIMGAFLGAGYWALVLMPLAAASTNAVLVWNACNWRPGLPRRGTGVRSMLAFGVNLSASNFLSLVPRNVDKLLLGAAWGTAPLGFYGKAFQLILLPARQINFPTSFVALPALSRLRHQPRRYREYYRRIVEIMLTLSMPIAAFALVAADAIVLTILGEQWMPSVVIFRALAPAALMQTVNVAADFVFIPMGRSDRRLRAVIFMAAVFVIACVMGLSWGPVGVALGVSVAFVICRPAIVAYALRGSPIRLRDFAAATWRPLAASAAAAALLWAARVQHWSLAAPIMQLVVQAALFVSFYFGAWAMLPGGRRFLYGVIMGTLSRIKKQAVPAGSP